VSHGLANDLRQMVESAEGGLRRLSPRDVSEPRKPGGWSKLEILGHLIDSASNNHQRFVRVQFSNALAFPDYKQEVWVACQDYRSREWSQLLDLWVAYNRHLAHVLEVVPAAKLDTPCRVGESQAIPLRELVGQYLAHMRHHLAQLSA